MKYAYIPIAAQTVNAKNTGVFLNATAVVIQNSTKAYFGTYELET